MMKLFSIILLCGNMVQYVYVSGYTLAKNSYPERSLFRNLWI